MKTASFVCAVVIGVVGCIAVRADTFTGTLTLVPDWTHQKITGASAVTERFATMFAWTHTTGTNANQMTAIYRAAVTLTNLEERVIDVAGGISDAFGDVTTFQTVRFLCVTAAAANTDTIAMLPGQGGWATWANDTNAAVVLRPGGAIMFVAPDAVGYVVTDGLLTVRNSGTNDATYAIYIGGAE